MRTSEQDKLYAEGMEKGIYDVTPGELEAKGEQAVRYGLAKGEYGELGSPAYSIALAFLDFKRSSREHETSRMARRANRIAWIAASIAAASIIKDIVMLLFAKN